LPSTWRDLIAVSISSFVAISSMCINFEGAGSCSRMAILLVIFSDVPSMSIFFNFKCVKALAIASRCCLSSNTATRTAPKNVFSLFAE